MSQYHGFAVDGFALTERDEFGCQWTVEDAQGWFAGGDVRTDTQPKMQQHGDWRGKSFRAGRVVTLRGKVFCLDSTALELAARRMSSVLADGDFGSFVGDSPAGVLSSTVQLEDAPLFDPQSSNSATWQLTLGSDDPLLYGPVAFGSTTLSSAAGGAGRVWPRVWPTDWGVPPGVTPGAITLANAGTASYFPRLRIDGPVPNPSVTLVETGDTVRFRGTVAAGQWLDIIPAKRRVLLNGQVSMRTNVSFTGRWLGVPVGGGSLTWTADAADPAATLSAWAYEGAWS